MPPAGGLQSISVQPAPGRHATDLRHDATAKGFAPQFRKRAIGTSERLGSSQASA
jgi:hypothetical protein